MTERHVPYNCTVFIYRNGNRLASAYGDVPEDSFPVRVLGPANATPAQYHDISVRALEKAERVVAGKFQAGTYRLGVRVDRPYSPHGYVDWAHDGEGPNAGNHEYLGGGWGSHSHSIRQDGAVGEHRHEFKVPDLRGLFYQPGAGFGFADHPDNTCKSCGGNDADVPCAYPGAHERQPHCLRHASAPSSVAQALGAGELPRYTLAHTCKPMPVADVTSARSHLLGMAPHTIITDGKA